ncbi:hypothetical protein Tco_1553404, partial [Tanacetum coccineum]
AKKRKREDNLRTWKWTEVIDVDALLDKVEPSNVPKPEETIVEPHVVASENISVINLTLQESDIPMAPFKRKKKDQIKITVRIRLCPLFDVELSDQEEDFDKDSSDQEEDLYEDSSDEEEYLDEDSSHQEEYLGEDESDQEEDLGKDESDQDDSDDGWV